jgi:hypothetical protein
MFKMLTRGVCSVRGSRWLVGPRGCKIGSKQKGKLTRPHSALFGLIGELALKDREEKKA